MYRRENGLKYAEFGYPVTNLSPLPPKALALVLSVIHPLARCDRNFRKIMFTPIKSQLYYIKWGLDGVLVCKHVEL